MMMNFERENKVLETLIDVNKDACALYHSAIERVRNPRLERSFSDLERLHGAVVSDLSERVRDNGGEPHVDLGSDGTLFGRGSRLLTELMARVSNDVDETLVAHLEEAEDRCLHAMRDALDSRDMQTNTRALLVSELGSLQRSHDYMKALKDSMHLIQRAA